MGKTFLTSDLLSADEAGAIMGVTGTYIRMLARQGRIPALRIAGAWIFCRADVSAWKPDRPRGRPRKPTSADPGT